MHIQLMMLSNSFHQKITETKHEIRSTSTFFKMKAREMQTEKKCAKMILTYWCAVEQHLLQVASIIVDSQVPRSGVHILNEASFLQATQQQAFRSFCGWDGISQGPGQGFPIQQFHKVELNTMQDQTYYPASMSKSVIHKTCINSTDICKSCFVQWCVSALGWVVWNWAECKKTGSTVTVKMHDTCKMRIHIKQGK